MKKCLQIHLLLVTVAVALLVALTADLLQIRASHASTADPSVAQAQPDQPAGTDWDAEAPAPEDSHDAAMPLPAVGMPATQPFVPAESAERPVMAAQASVPGAPAITLWYGMEQDFGQLGNPQAQINLLGTVTGTFPVSLTYALNSEAALPLSVGPDDQRLAEIGDFNIEITRTKLISGANQVVITATDAAATTTVLTATVNYIAGQTWPQDYTIDWSTVAAIQDVAQVVDGLWMLDSIGLSPLQFDYDRLVAIGDNSWLEYEVTVPIFIRGIDESGFAAPSNGPGIGLIGDWQGHGLEPDDGQPATGWRTQLGALAWYRWGHNNTRTMEIRGFGGGPIATNSVRELSFNVQYIMKFGVQRKNGATAYYRFKIWPANQSEPALWDVEGPAKNGSPVGGSLVLVAHHVDASFGDVTVTPLSELKSTLTVVADGSGTVNVDPQLAQYDYGQTVKLTANTVSGSLFERWSGGIESQNNPLVFDITQDTVLTANFTTTATMPISSTIVSDDFNSCALDPRWEFVNPLGDGAFAVNGTRVQLTAPEGTSHNVYDEGIPAPHVMQTVADSDFEVVTKFESSVNRRFQIQGIIVEQDVDPDAEDFLRFDFFHDGSNAHIYALSVRDGTPAPQIDDIITPSGIDYYLKVRREGDVWTQSYSFDGVTYIGRNFTLTSPFTATRVGPFAANHGNVSNPASIPAHTAIVDYFFNAASPIANEDGKPSTLKLTVTPASAGQVEVTTPPDKTTYACGEAIKLTATPATGYTFDSWSGTVEGSANPVTFNYELGAAVTATFVQEQDEQHTLYLPIVRR